MFNIRMAELNIKIKNKYSFTEDMCRDYIVDDTSCDFCIEMTDAEIIAEGAGKNFDKGYLESLAIYRKIAEKVLDYDGFLLHGAVVEAKKRGIAFCARSGTGKSTHIVLWKKLIGDECLVINGDKPIIRFVGDKVYAYGTPWCGKEGWQENRGTELTSVCFLRRSKENKIEKIENIKDLRPILAQVYLPRKDAIQTAKTLELMSRFVKSVCFYKLGCNMDISAAKIAFEGIMK